MWLSEKKYRAHVQKRRQINYEDMLAQTILEAVGRFDIYRDVCWSVDGSRGNTVIGIRDLYRHEAFDRFPMFLEYRNRTCQEQEPSLLELIREFPRTRLARYMARRIRTRQTLGDDYENQGEGSALGLIVSHDVGPVIIHNRPDWAQGRPLEKRKLLGGLRLAMHHFGPFVYDLADMCRYDMATEEGIELIESNADWREEYWEDYE